MRRLTKYFYNTMNASLCEQKPSKENVQEWYNDKVSQLQSFVWVSNNRADLNITEGHAKAYADYLGVGWAKTFPKDWI